MLYFLHGSNKDKAREKARELMEGLVKKRPEASLFKLETENFNSAQLEELVGGQGLFSNKYIVFLDGLFENAEIKEQVLKFYKEISESENIFIWLEGKVDKATLTKLEKIAEKVQKFESEEESGRKFSTGPDQSFSLKDFNIFSLADAFGRRETKSAWILLQKALMKDIPAEEIHGVIFWQVKSMMLAEEAKTASEAGLSPFVFSKSKKYAGNFPDGQLAKLSSRLVKMYHEAHRGIVDFPAAIEKLVLTI